MRVIKGACSDTGHYFSCAMREAKALKNKKHNSQMAAMYQVHVGGVSHRTTSRYDVANVESRLLRHLVFFNSRKS